MICCRSADVSRPGICFCEEVGTCRPEGHDTLSWREHIVPFGRCLVRVRCLTEKWPSLFALIKTLIRSPYLAQLVCHLRLTGPVPRSIWTTPQHTGLSNHERRIIETRLPCDSYLSKAGWLRQLDNGCPHAFAALLLVCLPGLRSLNLGNRFQDSLQILGPRLLERTLRHLDAATVGVTDATVWMGCGRAPLPHSDDFPQLLLLQLARIRSISLNLPQPRSHDFQRFLTCGAFTTCLETLELVFTFLNGHDLARLLQVCPRLQNFKYDYWTTSPSRDRLTLQDAPYTPDRLSERLVETQILLSSLNIVQRSLVTLHIHIVPPMERCNQNLRSIDFSRFESLTELHAPLQLLVHKDSSKTLANSLPPSLRRLWLNDDATRLWLNHDYIMSPFNYELELELETIPVDDSSWHPVWTDREVVDLISHFLSGWRAHVPQLQTLRLLFEHVHCESWRARNISYLRDTLEPAGRLADLYTTVTQVWRCRPFNRGQGPPYFEKERIQEIRCRLDVPDG
ncbi:hypothetical protein E4T44_02150 [Aureobasidium sp. EXF-8845]|nr:hypothetical protein E4T44_02150 [Aureobasidium sp. EXF-8845]KAI4856507.1 hypothetical protein E4T45_02026 [Aureobasidium sp. EXF-8846]